MIFGNSHIRPGTELSKEESGERSNNGIGQLQDGSNVMLTPLSLGRMEGGRQVWFSVIMMEELMEGEHNWYDHCLSALTTEALACRDGVQFAIEKGVERLQLETDCLVLVNLLKHPSRQNSEVGPILQQVYDLSQNLSDFSFIYANRMCNRLAHECAKLVSRTNLVEEWLVPPPVLRGFIHADCNSAHDQ